MAINVVTSTDLRNSLSDALDGVSGSADATLIRRNKTVEAALIDIDLLEELLELHDPKYRQSITNARKEAKAGKVYTLDQAFAGL